jgi:glycosyltransferase involved in cell wall biosynthesis
LHIRARGESEARCNDGLVFAGETRSVPEYADRSASTVNIAFFDATDVDYNAETPLHRPLGGSQSALCYLAVALTQLGHRVSLVNRTASPGRYAGVQSFGLDDHGLKCLQISEVVIVQNGAAGRRLREDFRVACPIILWTQHAHDQAAIQGLNDPRERNAWTGFAFTSRWNLDQYVERFGVRPERARILHNGIAPAFAREEPAPAWFETAAPPVLAYTSTPFRGLDVLLDAFPAVRAAIPNATLRVYSGMSVYGQAAQDGDYRVLYERCRQMPGAVYIGPVAQTRLAREISGIAALAYPSTFAETFCVAAAEAMSAGGLLLTTRLGALPELFGAFAAMVEPDPDRRKLAESYAALVIAELVSACRDPAGAAARRRRQIEFIRSTYAWPIIARQWAAWLGEVTAT